MWTLTNLIGRGALKAYFGGAGAVVAYLWTAVGSSCDLQQIGQNLGGAAGAFVVGYIMTWISPANKSKFPPAPKGPANAVNGPY